MRWVAGALAVVALAVGGMIAGLRIAGPQAYETELGTISLRVSPSTDGEVDAFIPLANWGVRANAFTAPLKIHVEPRSIARQAILRAAGGDRAVLADAERDGRDAARLALLRSLGWALIGAWFAALTAATLAHALRRPPVIVATALAAPVVVAAVLAAGALLTLRATFDPGAFETPRFYARGAELGQLLKVAASAQRGTRAYSSEVERTLAGYADLLQAGSQLTDRRPPRGRALLLSDLHGNAFVLDAIRGLGSGAPVFFAGDFGQSGTPAEAALLVSRVAALGRPLVAVSGNHDSRLLMRRLAGEGVVVLTEDGRLDSRGGTDGRPVQTIAGLRVAGFADPLEWRGADPDDPSRVFSFAERPDGDEELAAAQRRLVEWFEGLVPRPDVVMVHQNGLAQALARAEAGKGGPALLILTGHDHRQHVDRYDGVLVVDAGTAGAGGIFGAGKAPVGVAQIDLAGPGALPEAIDMIRTEPLSGAAEADRVVPDAAGACDTEVLVCRDQGEGDDPPADETPRDPEP